MDFTTKLMRAIEKNNSLLCVGLDPVESMLPEGPDIYSRLSAWAGDLIAQTADLVCCFKPNMGFFEQFGPKGMRALADILAQVPSDIPIVLDGKRGDIGSTAEAYARGAYTHFHADAVTLSPYLGSDEVKPFLSEPEKTAFIL
jgi:orotidine 5'-phosphate decarboxylase subfamily 2